jgi:hypothetical protein
MVAKGIFPFKENIPMAEPGIDLMISSQKL